MRRGNKLSLASAAVPEWSLRRACAEVAAAGLDGIELLAGPQRHLDTALADGGRIARRIVEDAGLELSAVAAPQNMPLGTPGLDKIFDAAESAGAPIVRVFAPAYRQGRPVAEQFERTARELEKLLDRIQTTHVAIEICDRTLAASPELAERALALVDRSRVGVVYDPANGVIEGGLIPEFAVGLLGPAVRHVHMKNYVMRPPGDRSEPWEEHVVPIDQGQLHWPAVLSALETAGYRGWFSIDYLGAAPTRRRLRNWVGRTRAVLEAA